MLLSFILPKNKRKDFKYPRSIIFRKFPLKRLEHSKGVVCVGDVVSKSCLNLKEVRNLYLIYDGSTKRHEKVNDLESIIKKESITIYNVYNPPGTITFQAFSLVCKILKKSGKIALRVIGEEDMLALPSIQCAPKGYQVLYGIPNVGVAMINVNELSKLDSSLRILELRPKLKENNDNPADAN